MTAELPEDLERLLVEREIRRLLVAYARAVDRRDFDLLRTVFHPDATDDHGPHRGGVDGLVTFLAEEMASVDSATHSITPVVVAGAGGAVPRRGRR